MKNSHEFKNSSTQLPQKLFDHNTITFLKAFSNTNYTAQATYVDDGSYGSYENLGCFNRTTSSMLINRGNAGYGAQGTPKVSWYVCGY